MKRRTFLQSSIAALAGLICGLPARAKAAGSDWVVKRLPRAPGLTVDQVDAPVAGAPLAIGVDVRPGAFDIVGIALNPSIKFIGDQCKDFKPMVADSICVDEHQQCICDHVIFSFRAITAENAIDFIARQRPSLVLIDSRPEPGATNLMIRALYGMDIVAAACGYGSEVWPRTIDPHNRVTMDRLASFDELCQRVVSGALAGPEWLADAMASRNRCSVYDNGSYLRNDWCFGGRDLGEYADKIDAANYANVACRLIRELPRFCSRPTRRVLSP